MRLLKKEENNKNLNDNNKNDINKNGNNKNDNNIIESKNNKPNKNNEKVVLESIRILLDTLNLSELKIVNDDIQKIIKDKNK